MSTAEGSRKFIHIKDYKNENYSISKRIIVAIALSRRNRKIS